jgi:hypothetical protein
MKTIDRAKSNPQIGHSTERLVEDRRLKLSERAQAGSCLCQRCGAVSYHKHWFYDTSARHKVEADPTSRVVLCPGCERLERGVIDGEVLLESELLETNHEMVYGTIYHVAAKAFLSNPLSRVATIEDRGSQILIRTTTKTLATRIGKAIHKAMKGTLNTKSDPGDPLLRLHWYRRNKR